MEDNSPKKQVRARNSSARFVVSCVWSLLLLAGLVGSDRFLGLVWQSFGTVVGVLSALSIAVCIVAFRAARSESRLARKVYSTSALLAGAFIGTTIVVAAR